MVKRWTKEELVAFDYDAFDVWRADEPTACRKIGMRLEFSTTRPEPIESSHLLVARTPCGWMFVRKSANNGE